MKLPKIDGTTLGIIIFAFAIIGILSLPNVRFATIPSQAIVSFDVQPTRPIPEGAPKPESSVIAFQSIAFSAGELTSDIIRLEEGPITLTKITFGLYNFIWLILIGIVIVLLLPKFIIHEHEEKDVPMNLINWLYLPIVFLSVLWMGGFLTGAWSSYSLFYIIMFVVGIAIIGYVRTKGFNINIAINDGILSNLMDVKFSTQLILSIFSIFGIFLALNLAQTNYAAFSISGDKFSVINVVPFEDLTLIFIPTLLLVLVGNIMLLSILAWINNEDASRILSLDKSFIVPQINRMQKPFLVGNVIIVILVATFCGYLGGYYHINAYKNIAPYVASRTGMSEEQAYQEILKSVGDFWPWSSIGISISGNIFCADIVHFIVNWRSS